MKRWRAAFLLAFLAALPILFAANRSAALLEDSDTKGILAAIRAVHDPFKWFRGDWPIENGFYRPIASLVFEADNALWGDRAAGYGLTNAALCFACILLLFWALREITDRPWPSALGAGLFAVWHVGPLNALRWASNTWPGRPSSSARGAISATGGGTSRRRSRSSRLRASCTPSAPWPDGCSIGFRGEPRPR